MSKLLNREADALKEKIAERDSRIRLWEARADELRKRCDYIRKWNRRIKE